MGNHDAAKEASKRIAANAKALVDEVSGIPEDLPAAGAVEQAVTEAEWPLARALSRVKDIKAAHAARQKAEADAEADRRARAQSEIDAEAERELAVEKRKLELSRKK